MDSLSFSRAWPAVAGPAAVAVALQLSRHSALGSSVTIGVVLVSVAAMTLPALYVGAALVGVAPTAGHLAHSVQEALTRTGLVWLGLAPALAFMATTATSAGSVNLLTHGVMVLGGLLALTALYRVAFVDAPHRVRAFVLFFAWAVVAFGLGHRLHQGLVLG